MRFAQSHREPLVVNSTWSFHTICQCRRYQVFETQSRWAHVEEQTVSAKETITTLLLPGRLRIYIHSTIAGCHPISYSLPPSSLAESFAPASFLAFVGSQLPVQVEFLNKIHDYDPTTT